MKRLLSLATPSFQKSLSFSQIPLQIRDKIQPVSQQYHNFLLLINDQVQQILLLTSKLKKLKIIIKVQMKSALHMVCLHLYGCAIYFRKTVQFLKKITKSLISLYLICVIVQPYKQHTEQENKTNSLTTCLLRKCDIRYIAPEGIDLDVSLLY